MKGMCFDCKQRYVFHGKGAVCKSSKNWFHASCQSYTNMDYANYITNMDYKNMQEISWISSYCAEKSTTEDTQKLKIIKRYVNDIVSPDKGNPIFP